MPRRTLDAIDQEASVVQAQLQILDRREADFQRIIDDMVRLRDSVRAEKAELEGKEKELEAERYPINWLPPELLAHIFIVFATDVGGAPDVDQVYHRPPVVLSHVCHKWRAIALATSALWTRVAASSLTAAHPALDAFLARSRAAPLDVVYSSSEGRPGELASVDELLYQLRAHYARWRSVVLECWTAESMSKMMRILCDPMYAFPMLRSLELSFLSPNLIYPRALLRRRGSDFGPEQSRAPALEHLRLQQIPPFNIPTPFLANLRSLELSYPKRSSYVLALDVLCRFLACTPQLEELELANTVPSFNVVLQDDTLPPGVSNPNGQVAISAVNLPCLQTLIWSYPFPADVHHFLSFLNVPVLERLDIWFDELPLRRRGELPSHIVHSDSDKVLSFPTLKDLSLQCVMEDTVGSVLRKLSFPALEKLDIANVDALFRGAPRAAAPAPLPRLESIFRDPRLPHLTHLSLAHFAVVPEHARAMLGYMPRLARLALDACAGAGALLRALGEERAGARVCPRLVGLTLWACADVAFADVRAVVAARSGVRGAAAGVQAPGGALGTPAVGAGDGAGAGGSGVAGRKIRPLKKLRGAAPAAPLAQVVPALMALEGAPPERIRSVRIEGCALIAEREALALAELGVESVSWSGVERDMSEDGDGGGGGDGDVDVDEDGGQDGM